MNTNSKLQKALEYFLIGFVAVTVLPFKLSFSSIFLVGALFLSLIYLFRTKDIRSSKWIFILAIPLCVYLLGILNSENTKYAFRFLERNLSLLFFPLIFYSVGVKATFNKTLLWRAFLFALVAVDSYLLFLNVYYFNLGEKFSLLITNDIYHSTYLGMYNLIGFGAMFFNKGNFRVQALKWGMSLLFVVGIMASSSRMVFILWVISCVVFSVFYFRKPLHRILWICFILVTSGIIVASLPGLSEKFEQIGEIKEWKFDRNNYQSLSSRIAKIEASSTLIKSNPIFGVGTGDLIDELVKEYEKMGFVMGYKYRYNPHNQFLDTIARNGLPGGILTIICLYLIPLYIGVKFKNKMLVFSTLVFMGVSLTESIFGLQRGITFFAFLTAFLLWETESTVLKND